MKVPLSWLLEFLELTPELASLDDTSLAESLAEIINLKIFEVSEVERVGFAFRGKIVSGQIVEIAPHPNADRLQITQAQISPDIPLQQIVCGAENIEMGQIVPVALPGSAVLNRQTGEELLIKESKIRGIQSAGMLCSASELGLLSDNEGIFILPSEWGIGLDLIERLGLKQKLVLHIESRSNRGDALCLQGIAREVAAATGSNLKTDYYQELLNNSKKKTSKKKTEEFPIKSQDACSNISFSYIKNVKIADSPEWLTERLQLSGIKSICNVVDILNYVMLEVGQPMHAYDASKVDWQNGLQVRYGQPHEKIIALDEKEYALNKNNLLISDQHTLLSLAGIIGGQSSSVTGQTAEILLEAACFQAKAVRRSSRTAGVSTESSRRFERGTDMALVDIAMKRVADLIEELAGGEIAAESSYHAVSGESLPITLNLNNYQKLMGYSISDETAEDLLQRLGFKIVSSETGKDWQLVSPSFRAQDIKREIDLIEELARLDGFEKVPPSPLPTPEYLIKDNNSLSKLKQSLVSQGYQENISSSLVSSEYLGLEKSPLKPISMKNPLSSEHGHLRDSLIPSMLATLSHNWLRQETKSLRLFEVGKRYGYTESPSDEHLTNAIEEELLILALSQKSPISDWQATEYINQLFHLKDTVEKLFSGRGRLAFEQADTESFLHPGIQGKIFLNAQEIGHLGQIHPRLAQTWHISEKTYLAQLSLRPLLTSPRFKLKKLNNSPLTHKDFTVDFSRGGDSIATHAQIMQLVQHSKILHLKDLELLSHYQTEDRLSLSYRLTFQPDSSNEKITHEQINPQIESLKQIIQSKIPGSSFRE